MTKSLPKGWEKTTLGAVCLPVEKIHPEESPDLDFTYFDIGGIDNERNRIAETKTVTGRNAPSRARQSVRKGDILFSTVRTYLRNVAPLERDYRNAVASTGFTVLRAAQGVSSEFLFFQVLTEEFLEPLHSLQTGTSYPAVRDSDVFAQPILLPPTQEQERIVVKLKSILSQIEKGETAARRAQKRLERYRASVLDSAVSGELTRAWRESQWRNNQTKTESGTLLGLLLNERRSRWEEVELRRFRSVGKVLKNEKWKTRLTEPKPPKTDGLPALPRGWEWASIDQLSWAAGYGTSVKCTYEAKGPAVLRIPNVQNRALDLNDLKFATSLQGFRDEDFVAPGDLLLIRTNGTRDLVGRSAIVNASLTKSVSFASYLIRFRLVGDETIWSWISLAWDSTMLRASLESRATTTAGQYNVSLSRLADLALPLPPTDERVEIVREVERRLAAADKLSSRLRRQLELSQTTRQSLLRDALSGRLVPQNPNDEPASNLLARIRATREMEAQKPKVKHMPKKSKSKALRRPLLDVLRAHKSPMTPEKLFADSGYQQEFEENECSQEVVDHFYEELRQLVGPKGPVLEKRPNRNKVLLEVQP